MSFFDFLYNKILLNQVVLSLLSSFIGAILGGYFTYRATDKSHKNSLILQEDKVFMREKSTVMSIVEELKILLESYGKEFEEIYAQLEEKEYVEIKYYVSKNYQIIFSENAGAIGLIRNRELREKIIKTEICLTRYLEYLANHTNLCQFLNKDRANFISRVYPKYVNYSFGCIDLSKEIENIKHFIKNDNWEWLEIDYINKMQIINFVSHDDKMIEELHRSSVDLKNRFLELKTLIAEICELSEATYK